MLSARASLRPEPDRQYVSVVDTRPTPSLREIPVRQLRSHPPVIRKGRGFLYDAKLSGNGTIECASCHVDAEMDMLAWDLGDPNGDMETAQVIQWERATGPAGCAIR